MTIDSPFRPVAGECDLREPMLASGTRPSFVQIVTCGSTATWLLAAAATRIDSPRRVAEHTQERLPFMRTTCCGHTSAVRRLDRQNACQFKARWTCPRADRLYAPE